MVRLSEVADPDAPIVYGILQAGPNVPGGVPYVRPSEIQDDRIVINKLLRTSLEIAERYRRSRLSANDVVLSIVGTIGKVALVPDELEGANINQSAVRIRLRGDLVLPEYLAWILRSPLAQRQYEALMFGSAVMRLNVAHVRALQVPVPPLDVQRQMVMDIENRLTRIRAGAILLERAQANLRHYRNAVFKMACEGRLVISEADLAVQQGRKFKNAEALIAEIPRPPAPALSKRRSRDVILGHAALAVGNPGTPPPAGWAWVALTDIARMESGHTPSRSVPSWWNGDVPWLGLADARLHDGRLIDNTVHHTNEAGLANSAARILPAGTVCVSRTASIGYVVILGRPMATSQDFVNWVPTAAISPQWLQIVFSADRSALKGFGKGSIHDTIYFPELLALHIALPPREEQARIAAEIARQTTSIEALQAALTRGRSQAMLLRTSMLAATFGGQDAISIVRTQPNDLDPPAQANHGPIMPARKRTRVRRLPLLPIVKDRPNGISVEELFIASGFFEAGDPDAFYQELARCRDLIEEIRPSALEQWPSSTSIILRMKEQGR